MADVGDRFDLIELDPPSVASEAPAPRPAPAPSPKPGPALVFAAARALLTSATDDRALDRAVAELVRQYPDASHPVRASLRPVHRAVVTAILWLRMWASVARAIAERPALVRTLEPAGVQPGLVNVTARPHTGSYARYQGSWLGFIPHTGRAVRPGDHVTLVRRNGGQQTYVIGGLVRSDYRTAGQVGSIVTFDADRPVVAPVAPVVAPAPAPTERQSIPVVSVPESIAPETTSAMSTGSLVEALTNASSEGASNASVQSATQAGSTLAGVGFTSAQGYVTALANGVKRGTADSYLATLATRYSYTQAQLAALTVTIIAEDSVLPVGPGIVHEPTGPDIFTQRREERTRAAQQIRATADAATVAFAQRLTTSGADQGAWWEIGWDGKGSITRGEILAACGIAPESVAVETQLGRTCDSLRGTHDCSLVTPPAGVKRRWQIGRGRQHTAYVGAEYGRVLAIVDLMPDGSLHWEGDSAICNEVRTEYDRLCAGEIFRPGDVTAWLSAQLRYRFGARKQAHNFLVPPERREAARELCVKLASVWSRGSWVYGRLDPVTGEAEIGKYVTDVADVLGGLLVSCSAEVTAAEKAWQVVVDAAKGGKVGARAAANALLRHDGDKPGEGLLARVNGLALLGDGPLAPLRARCAALRAKILAAVDAAGDSGSARAAMLELE